MYNRNSGTTYSCLHESECTDQSLPRRTPRELLRQLNILPRTSRNPNDIQTFRGSVEGITVHNRPSRACTRIFQTTTIVPINQIASRLYVQSGHASSSSLFPLFPPLDDSFDPRGISPKISAAKLRRQIASQLANVSKLQSAGSTRKSLHW